MVFELITQKTRGHLPQRFRRMALLYLRIEERNEKIASMIREKGWEEFPEYKQLLNNMYELEEKLRELDELISEKGIIDIVKVPITIYVAGLTTGDRRLLCARVDTVIEVPEVTNGVPWTSEAVFKKKEVMNKILRSIWVQTALWDNIDDNNYPMADAVTLQASVEQPSGCKYMAKIRQIPEDIQELFNMVEFAREHGYERAGDKYILK